MKNRLILIIFILFLTGCERKPLLDKLSGSKVTETITITEWGKWIPTHIIVKKDQTFTVTVTGKIIASDFFNHSWTLNPSGIPRGPSEGNNPFVQNVYTGVLVGKIGLTTPYILGASYTGISLSDGVLELGINNSDLCTLTSGSYTITITAE